MIKTFKSFIAEQQELLAERVIIVGKDKKFGQVIFLSGGAGSGKGFSIKNFIQSSTFKQRDVDEYKRLFLKINKIMGTHPEFDGLTTKNPDDVSKLHIIIKKKKIKDKTLTNLLAAVDPRRLPNILFDMTGKSLKDFPFDDLKKAGYKFENQHLIWVLTNYSSAIKNNSKRDRVTSDDVTFATHSGTRDTMTNFILDGKAPKEIGGDIYIILNNPSETIFYTGETDELGKPLTVQDIEKARKSILKPNGLRVRVEIKLFNNKKDAKELKDYIEKVKKKGLFISSEQGKRPISVLQRMKASSKDKLEAIPLPNITVVKSRIGNIPTENFASFHTKFQNQKPISKRNFRGKIATWINDNAPKK